jgi:cell filamentation protein
VWKSARLNQFESDHFFARLLELRQNPIRGSFDSDHLRHIHKYVYQTYTTGPENSARFRSPRATPFSPDELQKLFHQLAGEQYLRGKDSTGLWQRAAHHLGEINALHRYREGNNRVVESKASVTCRWQGFQTRGRFSAKPQAAAAIAAIMSPELATLSARGSGP